MLESLQPGALAPRVVLRRAVGVGVGGVIAAIGMRVSYADGGAAVVVNNFAFAPALLRVRAGTTVTWTNHDDMPHSVVCPALNLRSPPMDTGQSFSHAFAQAGTYDYVCGLHPFMHGQIVVTA